jgi:hypothetical protein
VIQINLLPPEYRKSESTPVTRFIAIVAGAVVVTCGLVAYGYVHYSTLRGVLERREQVEGTFRNAKAQADVARNLQAEIAAYEARRKAIQDVAKVRILQSRKLDEFLDVVTARGDAGTLYRVWLNNLSTKPARVARQGKATTGGTVTFAGYCESIEFSRVTNLRDAIKKHAYYNDFKSISRPIFKAVEWDDGLVPDRAGRFGFDLTLKPLGWQHEARK